MVKHPKRAEDSIADYYYKATDYYQANRNRVLTILTVVVVIAAVIFIYFRNQSSKNETANTELSKTKQLYLAGNYQQAINGDSLGQAKGLLFIVDNYGSTETGQSAKIMLANSYYNLRDFDNADKYYKGYSGGNEIFKSTAEAGIAAVLEAKGNYPDAARHFENAAKITKSISNGDEYLFYAVRNFFWAKDNENIKRVAKELKSEYPKSKFVAQLNRYDTDTN